jgi:hypothetical protein
VKLAMGKALGRRVAIGAGCSPAAGRARGLVAGADIITELELGSGIEVCAY